MQAQSAYRDSKSVLRCGGGPRRRGSHEKAFLTPEYAIVYLVEGAAQVRYPSEKQWTVNAGEAFQRYPGQKHDVYYPQDSFIYYIAMPAAVLELLQTGGFVPLRDVVLHVGTHPVLAQRFKQLSSRLRDSSYDNVWRLIPQMLQFMFELHHRHRLHREPPPALLETAQMLSEDFQTPLPEIAREVGMSYHLLRKKFRQCFNMSLRTFRQIRRMEKARELLGQSHTSLRQIAELLGYCDYFAFSRHFQAYHGLSPRDYRRYYRGH